MTCSARGSYSCCGAIEIAGVSTFVFSEADDFFDDVEYPREDDCDDSSPDPLHMYAAIIFTDISKYTHRGGFELARWIRSKRFGAVVSSRPALNNNSGNEIKVWVWTPNAAGQKYLKEQENK